MFPLPSSQGLLAAAASSADEFTSVNALSTLLTLEGFLFGVLNVAIAVTATSALPNRLMSSPRRFAHAAAALVTLVAVGALIAWWDLFIGGDWPKGVGDWAPVVVIGLAIVAQPVLTWAVARGVAKPGPAPPPGPARPRDRQEGT